MAIFGAKTAETNDKTAKSGKPVKNAPAKKIQNTKSGEKSMKDLYGNKDAKSSASPDKIIPKKASSIAYRILVKPLVTEKASILASENKYIFEVSEQANKIEIAKAISHVYGIKPLRVAIIRLRGKKVTTRRIAGKRKDRKKAIITLPAGKSMNVYEGV
jgi:large subunit ribosomal protein L23